MARKSIEDVMNEIEDFLNSCSTKALSSNKVIVPRDEFDELFGDLKVKIPAEIDRCKKIMRNKEGRWYFGRGICTGTADGIRNCHYGTGKPDCLSDSRDGTGTGE